MKFTTLSSAALAAAALMAPVFTIASPQSDTASSANSAPNADSSNKTASQKMKDCMSQQEATNSSSMSKSAMRTVCKNQMKKDQSLKNGNDYATAPQAETGTSKPQTPPDQNPPH
jgi:hypothetical protein